MKKINPRIVFLILILILSSNIYLFAQKVDLDNKVEYKPSEEQVLDDNSLSIDLLEIKKSSSKKKKRKISKRTKSLGTVNLLLNGNNLRFRKKRENNKCFETVVNCEDKNNRKNKVEEPKDKAVNIKQ